MENKMIQFYGYKKCSTCRKGEKLLEANGVEFEFIDITLNPPSEDVLTAIIKNSGKPIKKFFNTSGVVYREQKIKDKLKDMSESEMISLLASEGKLIKRPIASDGSQATVGFNEEEYNTIWK